MKRSAFAITVIVGISTLIQIVTQIVVTQLFGAKFELDVFLAAVVIPTIIVSIIYSTLSDVIIPLLKHEKKADLSSYIFSTAVFLGLIGIALSMILNFFSKDLVVFLYGTQNSNFVTQTTSYLKYLSYCVPFALVNVVFGSYLYSQKKFLLFPAVQLLGTVLGLGITVWLAPTMGIMSLIIAFFASLLIQLPFVFPREKNTSLSFNGSKLSLLLLSWIPLIVSAFAVRSDNLIMRSFSSHLTEGYIVYVNLASKLFAAAVGIMTIGIQTVFLPHLVDLIHSKKSEKIQSQVLKAKFAAWFVSAGVIAFILLVAPFFMRLILVGGKFSLSDVEKLIAIFPYFIIPALGWGVSQIYFQPLIALRKQHQLAILNVGAVMIAWPTASAIGKIYGDLYAITGGLIVLLFTGIIGAEILWTRERKLLQASHK